jgi:hypothetical protein
LQNLSAVNDISKIFVIVKNCNVWASILALFSRRWMGVNIASATNKPSNHLLQGLLPSNPLNQAFVNLKGNCHLYSRLSSQTGE